MTTGGGINRVVVVHGIPDPILTYVLTEVGLTVLAEIGDVTSWVPDRADPALRTGVPNTPATGRALG